MDTSTDQLYTPLSSPWSFRLLKVLDDEKPGEHSGCLLRCSLDVFVLDEHCPEYVALSYTWGSPFVEPDTSGQYGDDQAKVVMVSHDGRPACEQRIGRNLFDALVQVHRTKWQSYLWADAICINQHDPDERSSQVQLMREIYSKPAFVVAWLGPDLPDVEEIMWWYSDFFEYLQKHLEEAGGSIKEMMRSTRFRNHVRRGGQGLRLDGGDTVVHANRFLTIWGWFKRVRFFTRVWTLQELLLPPRVVWLLGSRDITLDPEIFSADANTIIWIWLGIHIQEIREVVAMNIDAGTILQMPPMPVGNVAYCVREIVASLGQPDDERRAERILAFGTVTDESDAWAVLELLIAYTNTLHATDSLDKIYGLLGIATKCVADPTSFVQVDYRITAVELLKEISVKLLTKLSYTTCFALRTPACYPRLQGLPSWAVDATSRAPAVAPGGLSTLRKMPHNACPTRNKENEVLDFQDNALRLYGHRCGSISTTLGGFVEDVEAPGYVADRDRLEDKSFGFVKNCLELLHEVGPSYQWGKNQSMADAIVQTVTVSGDADDWTPRIDEAALWVFFKRYLSRMIELSRQQDPITAGKYRKYMLDCRDLIIKLPGVGIKVPQPLLAYAQRLGTGDILLQNFEDQLVLEQEFTATYAFHISPGLRNRHLFSTEHGFLVNAADDAKAGDQLWLLCRARTPQILRPLPDGTFVTLGEAYVCGGLDGELIEKGIAGPLERTTIV